MDLGGLMNPMNGLIGQVGMSLLKRDMDQKAMNDQNAFNQAQTSEQMQFQERMSNTAYQRGVKDLQEAGLNPILAAGNSGASTPGGASASSAGRDGFRLPEIHSPDVLQYGVTMKQLQQMDERIAIDKANSAAGIAKTLTDAELNKAKKILTQKGMIRADFEGSAYDLLKETIKKMKQKTYDPKVRPVGESNDPQQPYFMP